MLWAIAAIVVLALAAKAKSAQTPQAISGLAPGKTPLIDIVPFSDQAKSGQDLVSSSRPFWLAPDISVPEAGPSSGPGLIFTPPVAAAPGGSTDSSTLGAATPGGTGASAGGGVAGGAPRPML